LTVVLDGAMPAVGVVIGGGVVTCRAVLLSKDDDWFWWPNGTRIDLGPECNG